ncbi:MAG: type II toxin-antitoxin system VapC family toxin [Acidobacteria bacterium]|nr:type II toxin-antitoxin system VapC family toxin [Acidobacteriota bacterium]
MTVLDTNVLSEVLRPQPSGAVLHWLAAQPPSDIYTTAITVAEVLYGIEALPAGKRRTKLLAAVEKMFAEQFDGRVLPFDEGAARVFAGIATARAAAGRPISQFDAMIAAIARLHRAAVATRNTADFEHCGVRVIDPWADS